MSNRSKNCFDPMRHIAALAVLLSHHFILSGAGEPAVNSSYSVGSLAVLAFFSISGYLITQSFVSSNGSLSYFQKRCARIFPALIVCAFLMVYPCQAMLGNREVTVIITSIDSLFSFIKISFFGQAALPLITDSYIFPASFNGSLWSLKIEFICYVALGIGLMLFRKPLMAVIMLCTAVLSTLLLLVLGDSDMATKLAIYGSVTIAFFMGSLIYFKRSSIFLGLRPIALAILSIGLLVYFWNSKLILAIGGIGFSFIFLYLGLSWGDRIIKGRFDISYGIYIYAFPVQQVVINNFNLSFSISLLISTIVTISLATLSWKFVEYPALRFIHSRGCLVLK